MIGIHEIVICIKITIDIYNYGLSLIITSSPNAVRLKFVSMHLHYRHVGVTSIILCEPIYRLRTCQHCSGAENVLRVVQLNCLNDVWVGGEVLGKSIIEHMLLSISAITILNTDICH